MTGSLGRLTAAAVAGSAALGLALTGALAGVAPSAALAGGGSSSGGQPPGPSIHSSDGVVGPIADPMPRARLQRVKVTRTKSYRVVRGVTYRQWDQTDARGKVRAYLVRADLRKPGLSLRYVHPDQVAARDELSDMINPRRTVAAVNGDFFDIGDTGAPLGVGVDRGRILHGPAQGWMKAFSVPAKGTPGVGELPVHATVATLPDLGITNVNSPWIPPHGIGLYTSQWGTAPGYAVTDGAKPKDVRQVVIQDGVVVSNSVDISSGTPIDGQVLIGRGYGAVRLNQQMPVGTPARITLSVDNAAQLAIGGSEILLHDGRIQTTDDGEMHPRTAVGVDTDNGEILLLVIDGRQDFSRGYTLLELARMLKKLGADEALNLDGGGSSTMIARRPSGRDRVANSPSDGQQRQVADGLQLVYRPR